MIAKNYDKKHKNIEELSQDEDSALKVNSGVKTQNSISEDQKKIFLKRKRKKLNPEQYLAGLRKRDRVILGKAITLIESRRKEDNDISKEIINKCLPFSGNSIRIGITGVPGVGKSTFIEAFGKHLLKKNKKIAVLAVDPSSSKTGGSLLGDKTRMEELSGEEDVFIRPSASSGFLGGVNRATRETIILCEAAGYDVILIETVGVGQSEVLVHSMVDFFLLLGLAGAGDELQGIKKGIMEMADAIAITKADGDNILKAEIAKKEKESALHYSYLYNPDWNTPVTTCSSLEGTGIEEIWQIIINYIDIMKKNENFFSKRKQQLNDWLNTSIVQMLENQFYTDEKISNIFENIRNEVQNSRITPINAAEKLIEIFRNRE